ncbi:MAG: STAS domain-containing protein [Kibdelosporangium sp.]
MTRDQGVSSAHVVHHDAVRGVGRAGTFTVLHLTGEIDLAAGSDVERALHRALDSTPSMLVIDLSGVTFLGSTGLAMLLEARKRATRTNIDLRLVAQQRAVLRVLEITGVASAFRIHASLEHVAIPSQADRSRSSSSGYVVP